MGSEVGWMIFNSKFLPLQLPKYSPGPLWPVWDSAAPGDVGATWALLGHAAMPASDQQEKCISLADGPSRAPRTPDSRAGLLTP